MRRAVTSPNHERPRDGSGRYERAERGVRVAVLHDH